MDDHPDKQTNVPQVCLSSIKSRPVYAFSARQAPTLHLPKYFIGDPYVGFKLIILIGSGMRFIRTGGRCTPQEPFCRSPPSVSPQRGLPGGYTSWRPLQSYNILLRFGHRRYSRYLSHRSGDVHRRYWQSTQRTRNLLTVAHFEFKIKLLVFPCSIKLLSDASSSFWQFF